jgi:hypothetical protein
MLALRERAVQHVAEWNAREWQDGTWKCGVSALSEKEKDKWRRVATKLIEVL